MSAKSLSLALIAGFSLVSVLAFADSTTGPTPSPTLTPVSYDDFDFACRFEGGGTGKDGTWFKRCEAEGKIDILRRDDFHWILGDRDDFARIRCDDRDDDHHHDGDRERVLYGLIRNPNGGDDNRVDTLITEDRTDSPLIRIQDRDFHTLGDDNGHGVRQDHRLDSTIRFQRDGFSYLLQGHCEFRRHEITPVPVH